MNLTEEELDEMAEKVLMQQDLRAALDGDREAWEELLIYFGEGGIAHNSELHADIFMMLMRGEGPGDEMYESICEDLREYLWRREEDEEEG